MYSKRLPQYTITCSWFFQIFVTEKFYSRCSDHYKIPVIWFFYCLYMCVRTVSLNALTPMSNQNRISPYNIFWYNIYNIFTIYLQYIYNMYNIFLNKIQYQYHIFLNKIKYQVDRWWEKRKIIRGLLVDPIPNSPN